MPYKDPERQREYQRNYQAKLRETDRKGYNEYHRKWRSDNPDRVKEHKKAYARKCREIGAWAKRV